MHAPSFTVEHSRVVFRPKYGEKQITLSYFKMRRRISHTWPSIIDACLQSGSLFSERMLVGPF